MPLGASITLWENEALLSGFSLQGRSNDVVDYADGTVSMATECSPSFPSDGLCQLASIFLCQRRGGLFFGF